MKLEKIDLEEYHGRLQELHDDYSLLQKEEVLIKDRKDNIKDIVCDIADTVGAPDQRVELYFEDGIGFDRQVRKTGGGLDVAVLEAAVGTKEFRELFCRKVTSWEFDTEKFEAARKLGKLDDETVAKCMIEPTLIPALKMIGGPQVKKEKRK